MESLASDKEFTITLAVEDAETIGLRASARYYALKLWTLHNQVNGAKNIRTIHKNDQSLTVI